MKRRKNRGRFWILMLLISGIGITSMSGCIIDRDHWHHHHDYWR